RDVVVALADAGQHLGARGRLAFHRDVAGVREDLLEPGAHDRVIVGEEQPDHVTASALRNRSSGIETSTSVPPPGGLVTLALPPSVWARSLMPRIPYDLPLASALPSPTPLSRT